MSELRHGTRSAYVHHHCRCNECRSVNAAYQRSIRQALSSSSPSPNDPRHGTVGFYVNHGCRCLACYEAKSVENRNRTTR